MQRPIEAKPLVQTARCVIHPLLDEFGGAATPPRPLLFGQVIPIFLTGCPTADPPQPLRNELHGRSWVILHIKRCCHDRPPMVRSDVTFVYSRFHVSNALIW